MHCENNSETCINHILQFKSLLYLIIIADLKIIKSKYHLVSFLQPERGVGTHCVVELMGEEFTADVDPQKVLLGRRQVPGCIRTGGMQVKSQLAHRRANRPIVPFKQVTVKEHSEVGHSCQAWDGGVTCCLQNLCRGRELHLFLVVSDSIHLLCPGLVEFGVACCRREVRRVFLLEDHTG